MPNVSKDTGEHVPTQAPELLDQHQTAERESGSQERLLANTIRINETISEVLNESAAGSNPFARYGLKFNADGSLDGPNRPSLYAQIPEISFEGKEWVDLASNKAFLERVFKGDRLSLTDDKAQLMAVVGKIFFATTGRALHDYVNIIFMDKADWNRFKLRIRGNADELNNFDAIHLGGLIVVGAEGDDRILPLLFHEAGHSLYPASDDRFTDELRAYYFQRICTEILHKQLQGLGLFYRYTEQHEDDVFPSMEHKNAYHSASALYLYQ